MGVVLISCIRPTRGRGWSSLDGGAGLEVHNYGTKIMVLKNVKGRPSKTVLSGFFSSMGVNVNAAIGVQHTEVPNLGASWYRNLTVTVMVV